jgi:hypothetical protein
VDASRLTLANIERGFPADNGQSRNVFFVDSENELIKASDERDLPDNTPEIVNDEALARSDEKRGKTWLYWNPAYLSRFAVAVSSKTTNVQLPHVLMHEIGHMLGLAHSPIGVDFTEALQGNTWLPTMNYRTPSFLMPVIFLHPSDIAWISRLYPRGSLASKYYGEIAGDVTVVQDNRRRPLCGATILATPVDSENRWPSGAVSATVGFTGLPTFRLPAVQGKYRLEIRPLSVDDRKDFRRHLGSLNARCGVGPVIAPFEARSLKAVDVEVTAARRTSVEIEVTAIPATR